MWKNAAASPAPTPTSPVAATSRAASRFCVDRIMVSALSILVAAALGTGPTLGSLRGKHRVAVIFGEPDSTRVVRQRKALDDPGAKERDLVVLVGTPELRRHFGLKGQGFAFVLIGKDGHPALVRKTPISRRDLYALIDAMPMRRAEMKRKG